MQNEILLMMPGPVPMPERVKNAMSRQAINHRGEEFGGVYADCVRALKPFFGTKNEIFLLSGSGTAGMEAAIANIGVGKKIASLVNGKFGERLAEISGLYGELTAIESEWGHPLGLDALAEALENGAEVVTMVHNETSAGILNPAAEVGKLARKHDALFIMDGITSIGGEHVAADEWGADIAIVGSQKCLAAPAGLSAVSVSERAWERLSEKRPYYLDLKAYRKAASKKPMETPYTPAVPLFFAFREACLIAEEEGLEKRIARHRKLADAIRAATAAWGLDLLPVSDALHSPSNTATAILYPDGISDSDLRSGVKKTGIQIAGGQDRLKGKIFRIGTMGAVGTYEVLATLAAVQGTLQKLGYTPAADGVSAALEVLV